MSPFGVTLQRRLQPAEWREATKAVQHHGKIIWQLSMMERAKEDEEGRENSEALQAVTSTLCTDSSYALLMVIFHVDAFAHS